MPALEKPTGRPPTHRFAVIADAAPQLSVRRQSVRVHCPQTGLTMLFTDVMSVGNLSRPNAQFSCIGCGEMHPADGHRRWHCA